MEYLIIRKQNIEDRKFELDCQVTNSLFPDTVRFKRDELYDITSKYPTVNIKPLKDLIDEGYDPYDKNHHIQVQRMLKIIGEFIDDIEGNNNQT